MDPHPHWILYLVINFGILIMNTASQDNPKDKNRVKNKIEENVGFTTDDTSLPWPDILDNTITTERNWKDQGGPSTVETPHSSAIPPKSKKKRKEIDPIDQYLLDGLLDIVDEKFATLSKRLSTLERGVHSVQYYNVRSFRVINTHLHAVDTMLHGINRQIDQVDQQNAAFNQGIDSIKKEMLDLQSLNNGMFQAIEQNLVHFHKDMQSRLEEMKGDMDKANRIMGEVKNDTNELRMDTDNVKNLQTDILLNTENSMIMTSDVAKGTLFLLNITEHVQQDVIDNVIPHITQTQSAIKSIHTNISKISVETHDIRNGLSHFLRDFSSKGLKNPNVFHKEEANDNENYKELKVKDSVAHAACSKMLQLFEDKLKNFTQVNDQTKPVTCSHTVSGSMAFRNQSRKLLRALSTVNENIYQSVTLYKHTGNLIERVISDAELIASDQIRLRDDIRAYLLNGTEDLFNDTLPDIGEFVRFDKNLDNMESRSEKHAKCKVTKDLVNEISKFTHNGTQLLELLTELATTSTSTMQLSLNKLESEVRRLHEVQVDPLKKHSLTKVDNFARDDPRIGANDAIKDLQNRTDWIYQLTEAIASNSGWIPYLVHNMRFVESQMNKSLKLSAELLSKTNDISSKQQVQASSVLTPHKYLSAELIKSQTNLHTMLSKFNDIVTKQDPIDNADNKCGMLRPEIDDISQLTNQSLVLTDMVEFVHGTSVKLNRLIPALTILLGEPEPYLTLLNGSSDKEGRVEIYYKGQWGTVPGPIGHVEASYICRKLGFFGGISAGNGSFGAGSGVFWNLNVTCLRTRWCTSVQHVQDPEMHEHENDVGVICDHMIRLEPNEEDLDLSRHSGKLEIYHENAWRPVCHDGWGRRETDVACTQLGFREGAASPVKDETLVNGQWLTKVTCSDNDDRLDVCRNGGFLYGGCPSSSYVSMICS